MANELPTQSQAAQAQAFMIQRVHVPAFFEKLAANGIEPPNEVVAEQLLQLGAVMAEADAAGHFKQAAADQGNPLLSYMLDRLQPQAAPDVATYVKQSADKLAATSELARNAAVIYAHAALGGELAPDA
jgi:hypothetical protein